MQGQWFEACNRLTSGEQVVEGMRCNNVCQTGFRLLGLG